MSDKSRKTYGQGDAEHARNPFFPGEKSYDGGKKGIVSSHGSNFSMDVHKTNAMDEGLGKANVGPRGRTTDDLGVNG